MINQYGIIIDGASLPQSSKLYGIGADEEAYPVEALAIADGTGGTFAAKATGVILIDGEVNYVFSATRGLARGWEYDITGTVYPVGVTVYLMPGMVAASNITSEHIAAVKEHYDRRTRADAEDGYFQFNSVSTDEGGVTVLAIIPAAVYGAMGLEGGLTVERTLVGRVDDEGGDGGGGDAGGDAGGDIDEGVDTIWCYPNITSADAQSYTGNIQGTASSGAAVYLSRGGGSDEISLSTTMIDGTTAAEETGEYVFNIGLTYDFDVLVVWTRHPDRLSSAHLTTYEHICLTGESAITMADGSLRRLDSLEVGDLVRAGDGSATPVSRLKRGSFSAEHRRYAFEDGTVIDAPRDHRFFNCEQGFFQYLSRWALGEHARRQDGSTVALVSVETVREEAECFGIWTEARDYWANGLLSGETGANQQLLATATAEQAADMAASLGSSTALKILGLEGFYP